MNMKTIKKLVPKIALVLVVLSVLAVVMSSCGDQGYVEKDGEKEEKTDWKTEDIDMTSTWESDDFLDKILAGIGWVLDKITFVMPDHNYLLTLLVFAIFMELVMLPFSIKQHKNSIKQAKLKPKEMAIRKKYAGRTDQATQQKVTQEIQELYQQEHFNPFGGCLPLLIQFPIIIVLYRLVVDPIKYVCGYSSSFIKMLAAYITRSPEHGGLGKSIASSSGSIEIFSKVKEIYAENPEAFKGIADFCGGGERGEAVSKAVERIIDYPASFNIGPINFGLAPGIDFANFTWDWSLLLLLIPVLTFVVYFFSMKLNRKLSFQPTQSADDRQQACSNKMMDITMPLMSVWMTFMVPGAVGIYWIYKSIIGVGKQFILSKIMPLPKFTEEDYKAAEKEMAGKQPKRIVKSENAGKVRSLHHIDDEDYDEKGNYVPKKEEPIEIEEKLKDNEMTSGASLKDESDKSEKTEKKPLFNFKKKNKKDDNQ